MRHNTGHHAAGGHVQLGIHTEHTSEDYVRSRWWRHATLERCPRCGREPGREFSRHSPYERKNPPGAWIARYWCRPCHTTFSLLPDCIAARLPSTLDDVEAVVVTVEEATSFEQACFDLRPELRPAGRRRWVRRRLNRVALFVAAVATLGVVELGHDTRIVDLRNRLGTRRALASLRQPVSQWLHHLPAPVGFAPRSQAIRRRVGRRQHKVGPDPPR